MPELATLTDAAAALATPAVSRRAQSIGVDLAGIPATGPASRVTLRDLERHVGGPVPDPRQSIEEGDHVADVLATAVVRRVAAQREVDLGLVLGTGPGGRIRLADLQARGAEGGIKEARPAATSVALRERAPRRISVETEARRGTVAPLSEARLDAARRAMSSLGESAQLTAVVEADLSALVELSRSQSTDTTPYGLLAHVASAAVAMLPEHPVLNATLDLAAGSATYHHAVHLGLDPDGRTFDDHLVITHADGLDAAALQLRVISGGSTTTSATFSVVGLAGPILFATPLLPLGQSAVLAVGAVRRRPTAIEGPEPSIAIRSFAFLSLTYDHRLVDGADAARFLSALVPRLEHGA